MPLPGRRKQAFEDACDRQRLRFMTTKAGKAQMVQESSPASALGKAISASDALPALGMTVRSPHRRHDQTLAGDATPVLRGR